MPGCKREWLVVCFANLHVCRPITNLDHRGQRAAAASRLGSLGGSSVEHTSETMTIPALPWSSSSNWTPVPTPFPNDPSPSERQVAVTFMIARPSRSLIHWLEVYPTKKQPTTSGVKRGESAEERPRLARDKGAQSRIPQSFPRVAPLPLRFLELPRPVVNPWTTPAQIPYPTPRTWVKLSRRADCLRKSKTELTASTSPIVTALVVCKG